MSDTTRSDSESQSLPMTAAGETQWLDFVYTDFARELERENQQLQTKLVIAETTRDELLSLLEKNQQLREAVKVCAEALNNSIAFCTDVNCEYGKEHAPDCMVHVREKALSHPSVQAALKEKEQP